MMQFQKFLNIKNKSFFFNIIFILIFISFFIYGIFGVKNYGVAHDEGHHRLIGIVNLNYLAKTFLSTNAYDKIIKNKKFSLEKFQQLQNKKYQLENYQNKFYGGIYPAFLTSIEFLFKIKDDRNIYLVRHFINFFIYFLSSISLFFLVKNLFNCQITSLAALILFILNPRFFSESIYNTLDLILFSTCIFLFERFFSFLKKPNTIKFILIIFFSILAINLRVIGITFVFIISFLFLINYKELKRKIKINIFLLIFVYASCSALLSLYSFPYLWVDTLDKIKELIDHTANHTWPGQVLYFGKLYNLEFVRLPWHYLIVWIFLTLPILNIVLFIIFPFIASFKLRNSSKFLDNNLKYYGLIFFLSTLTYIFLFIFIEPKIYDGWRHFYFLNFFILMVSIFSFHYVYHSKNFFKKLFILLFTILSFNNLSWIIKNHPYEYLYFNELSQNFINKNFELDYWGLTAKTAVNEILDIEKNERKIIKIYPIYINLNYSLKIFKKDRIKKVEIVKSIKEANYIIQNNRGDKFDIKFEDFNLIFTKSINSKNVLNIFKRKKN